MLTGKKVPSLESPPSVEYLTTVAAPAASLKEPNQSSPKKARSGSPVFNTTNNYNVNSSNVHFSGTGTGPRSEQSIFAAMPEPPAEMDLSSIPSFAIGKAQLAQSLKHRKVVDELLRSRKVQQPSKEGLGGTVLLHEHLQRQHLRGAFKGSAPLCRILPCGSGEAPLCYGGM